MIDQQQKPVLLQRRTCVFAGRVQGVGFRYTAQNIAMRFAVGGYVRNLPDGRVEIVLEGSPDEMDQMVASICQRMNGFVKHIDQCQSAPTGEFAGFNIRH